jgi:hypothetical protein
MGRFSKQVSNMINFPFYQKSVLVGLLLSDGYLFSSGRAVNFGLYFKQAYKNSGYVYFVFSIFSHYCNVLPSLVNNSRTHNSQTTMHYGLAFRTRSLPCFNGFYSLFYKDKVKIIPEGIYNLLTAVALAHLIMGDGSSREFGLEICTDCYSVIDVVRLMNVLIVRYNLDCTLHYHRPNQPRIYIRQRSMPTLRELVRPHMEKSMLYKIEARVKIKPVLEPKLVVTNMLSGEITKFVTIQDAAKALNVSHTLIGYYLRNKNKKNKPLQGMFRINYLSISS